MGWQGAADGASPRKRANVSALRESSSELDHDNNMHRKGREGAVSPSPVYMDKKSMNNYLQDLRNNRPVRPTGSRPPPAHFNTWSSRNSGRFSDLPTHSLPTPFTSKDSGVDIEPPSPTLPEPKAQSRTNSNMSIDGVISTAGRPLVQPPRGRETSISPPLRERTPSIQYKEGGRRQSERLEARAVRIAMEQMDLKSEQNLYEAARDEAAELVYKHQNPDAPSVSPSAPYPYPGAKGSSERSRSVPRGDQDLQRTNSKLRKRHSMSSATGSRSSSLQSNRTVSGSSVAANAPFSTSPVKVSFSDTTDKSKSLPKASSTRPGSRERRRSSSARRRASTSLFKNPDDQIYEEPEEDQPTAVQAPAQTQTQTPALASVDPPTTAKLPVGMRRNPFARVQLSRDNNLVRSHTDPVLVAKRFDRYEIQKNPPTQSRNAEYTSNSELPRTSEEGKSDVENGEEIKMKDGKEIRSDELRAATGFKLKDRSPKLPTPTMVSDSPGRPIVSFKKDWRKEIELKEEISLPNSTPRPLNSATQGPRLLSKAATAPAVPTVSTIEESKQALPPAPVPQTKVSPTLPAPSPSMRVNRAQAPAINIYEDPPARPLPSRKVNTPPQNATPAVPTINVHQAPSQRSKLSQNQAPPIPSISVQDTPKTSFGGPSRSPGMNAPSTSVTPPIPTISISETPAPSRGSRFNAPSSFTPSIPTISVSETSTPSRSSKFNAPSISVTPTIPTISVDGTPAPSRGSRFNSSVPTISVNESPAPSRGVPQINAPSISVTPSVPTINVNGTGSTRPLPDPKTASRSFGNRNMPSTRPRSSHWTPTSVRTGALCEQCALPIAGRIVSAGGSRFHPECFRCHHCGEHLECVAFYPEPESNRAARVARIHARLAGEDIEFLPSHPTLEDMQRLEVEDAHDESLRFYCHLDFHELFSPRCKSCKTPIEGEVVVACGAEWHPGHFFCAQCGDPFDSSTPFVEKEGYAWCVGCHTNRYSTKCRKCKRPVTETVVKALGFEWHVGCFCCVECSGPFDDGRYFLRGESQDPVCVKCEERRLKA